MNDLLIVKGRQSYICEELTVYFEDPFWVGVFQRTDGKKFSVCKVVFGAEPKDCEVYAFLLKNFDKLNFCSEIKTKLRKKADNPKRRIRIINKQLGATGISTKSQQALSAQREECKIINKTKNKLQLDAIKQRKYELRREKQKEKHRGK